MTLQAIRRVFDYIVYSFYGENVLTCSGSTHVRGESIDEESAAV